MENNKMMTPPACSVAGGGLDQTALFKASYGLYVLSAKNDEKDNACIVNTFLQITSSAPFGCLISVNRQNFTADIISETLKFNLSTLTVEADFAVLKRFGYQSGRQIDKFNGFTPVDRSSNGLLYLTDYANAYLSFDVFETVSFDSHYLFKAYLTESKILSEVESLTYDYYQKHIKPKPATSITSGYRCNVCGYLHESPDLPPHIVCPVCKHGASNFVKL